MDHDRKKRIFFRPETRRDFVHGLCTGLLLWLPPVLWALFVLPACERSNAPSVVIDSITPNAASARGGTLVTIKGKGFKPGATVWFDETVGHATTVLSDTELTVRSPNLPAGPLAVCVENPDGGRAVLENGFSTLALDLAFDFAPAQYLPELPEASINRVQAVDLDRDGDPDLAMATTTGAQILVNTGTGLFTRVDTGDPTANGVSTLPHWSGDSRDLVRTRLSSSTAQDASAAADLVVCRFDGPALLFAQRPAADATGYENPVELAHSSRCLKIEAADLNLDGLTDLIMARATADATETVCLHFFLRTETPLSAPDAPFVPTTATRDGSPLCFDTVADFAVGDVDGQGGPDLIVSARRADDAVRLRLFLLDLQASAQRPNDPALPADSVTPWLVSTHPETLPGATSPAASLLLTDLDGDRDHDLYLIAPEQDRLLINDGFGHFFDSTFAALPIDRADGQSAASADLDLDGNPDLIIANQPSRNRLYLNRGNGTFEDHTPLLPVLSTDLSTVRALLPVDVDLDGDYDLFVITADFGDLQLLVSTTPGGREP
jgi:hypothetical protein